MRIFDPHIHMTSRTTDDYEAMADAGVSAIVEPAFWLGQPRTTVGSFVDYFASLVGWEPYRAAQFGIAHHCTIALNPKEANDTGLAKEVLAVLPRWLAKDRVVAVGEVGYDSMTPAEDAAFTAQVALAVEADLPMLVHTPHRDKLAGTKRTLDVLAEQDFPAERTIIDHNNELTVEVLADTGCWMAFSIYPDTKVDERRMVAILQEYGTERMLVNSAADWGRSDPLKVAKVVAAMREAGFSDDDITTVVWDNPVAAYGRSGRLELAVEEQAPDSTWEGSSIRRTSG